MPGRLSLPDLTLLSGSLVQGISQVRHGVFTIAKGNPEKTNQSPLVVVIHTTQDVPVLSFYKAGKVVPGVAEPGPAPTLWTLNGGARTFRVVMGTASPWLLTQPSSHQPAAPPHTVRRNFFPGLMYIWIH